ncbi:hypothetical protein Tco_0893360 [Tanacetum coccineum]|uniref:Uncharacterized protein n=1 Tax=Tanacetum coccineum TaxID=301880 RepID=A0ABQ5C9X0_9ASTR
MFRTMFPRRDISHSSTLLLNNDPLPYLRQQGDDHSALKYLFYRFVAYSKVAGISPPARCSTNGGRGARGQSRARNGSMGVGKREGGGSGRWVGSGCVGSDALEREREAEGG